MTLGTLNKVALAICGICSLTAVILVLLMIWSDILDGAIVWKLWATVGVLFAVSFLTMVVTKKFQTRELEARKANGV